MSIRLYSLRLLRDILYRLKQFIEQKYKQSNRLLLREINSKRNPIQEATSITDRYTSDEWQQLQPVWVLSTGRTGTNTLTELLKLSPSVDAYHEPSPELFQFSYDYHMERIGREQALQALMYLRDEIVSRSFRDGLIYVETNNRVTYIADLLLELYPGSKFIHIFRNPYDFIRSGMRRKYYSAHMRDSARIRPKTSDPHYQKWEKYSNIEKVAWNWTEVNAACIGFMERLHEEQKLSFSSECFFEAPKQLMHQLFDFVGSDQYYPSNQSINRIMGAKHNAQLEGSFSRPKDWTEEQLQKVDQIIAPVARQLFYNLFKPSEVQKSMHPE